MTVVAHDENRSVGASEATGALVALRHYATQGELTNAARRWHVGWVGAVVPRRASLAYMTASTTVHAGWACHARARSAQTVCPSGAGFTSLVRAVGAG